MGEEKEVARFGDARVVVEGLDDDDSPLMWIRGICSCGLVVSERRFDVSVEGFDLGEIASRFAEVDGEAMLRHLREHR